jgi:hypothetical protein
MRPHGTDLLRWRAPCLDGGGALTDLGYTVVPDELLESDYDGPRIPRSYQHAAGARKTGSGSCIWSRRLIRDTESHVVVVVVVVVV